MKLAIKNIKDTIKMEKQMESGLIGMRMVINP